MTIREIELNNFRIYKGKNKIELFPDENKNIIIVSGNNGFGKTTFLMSLVWCLYGKNMGKVDELYRKEIDEKGGYSKYIGNSLNFAAQKEGKTRFSVSVTFTDVEIPDTPCTEITITRSYDSATNYDDELEILIDGRKNDLFTGTKEEITKEEEIFIRDYILPIEIAKFFFFDAEKIVSFAQINTPEQRKDLSLAYSQVLGIQKYEDLKNELVRIQDDYRKVSAKPEEKRVFNALIADIDFKDSEIKRLSEEIVNLEDDRAIKRHDSTELQSKLIREGDMMSADELTRLNVRKTELETMLSEAVDSLKDLYSLIPFGLAGGLMAELSVQLETEKAYKQNKLQLEGVNDKTDVILGDIEEAKRKLPFPVDIKTRDFYESQIRQLIKKHFYNVLDESKFDHFSILHDFSQGQIEEFKRIIVRIKESKSSFENLFYNYTKAKAELYTIEKNIREAEKKAESDYVQKLRTRKEDIDRQIDSIGEEIGKKQSEIEALRDQVIAHKKQKEILSKKIDVSEQNRAVDNEATRLIHTIQKFLIRFKEEKKKALAKKLEEKLQSYLHKTDLVKKVIVDINGNGDDVDICLFGYDDKKIDNGILSMGERQMFASALLSALVDETEFEFPVFIDSPMQKFDPQHTRNVLTKFYPNVSKQVILFPLLKKELTEEEYQYIKPIVNKSYLINNEKDGSYFVEVKPEDLFKEYNNSGYAN
ncbi:MAG: DNA sulfur modification protein DndD [Bacteroidales bacterium]|nr:DNA sulfur modification protein DndD [Bacteroidales bacterium]MDD6852456.1 DNA sulfur modification protein DndD [Bacteroidales bacterium]